MLAGAMSWTPRDRLWSPGATAAAKLRAAHQMDSAGTSTYRVEQVPAADGASSLEVRDRGTGLPGEHC